MLSQLILAAALTSAGAQPAKPDADMAAERWEMAGAVGIDTGRLLLIDPAYVSELPDAGPYAAYGITVQAASGTAVNACPVRVLRAKDGTIAAVRVDFVPDARPRRASRRRAVPASQPRRPAAPLNAKRV